MIKRLLILGVLALVGGCGEKPQNLVGSPRQDVSAFQGTGTVFAAPGWKQGDRNAWEQQLRTRAQNSQNEYNKVN